MHFMDYLGMRLILQITDSTNYGTQAVITGILKSKNQVSNRLHLIISCIIINTTVHAVAYFRLPASRALTSLLWRPRVKVSALFSACSQMHFYD